MHKGREARPGGQSVVDDDGVLRQQIRDRQHQPFGIDRAHGCFSEGDVSACLPVGRPVASGKCGEAVRGALALRRAAEFGDERRQHAQRLVDIGANGDFRRIGLAHLPVVQPDLDDRHMRRQRLDLAIDRHAQEIGAEADHCVVGIEAGAHGFLVARQRPEIGRMVGREMRPLQHRLVIDGAAHDLGKTCGLGKGVARG